MAYARQVKTSEVLTPHAIQQTFALLRKHLIERPLLFCAPRSGRHASEKRILRLEQATGDFSSWKVAALPPPDPEASSQFASLMGLKTWNSGNAAAAKAASSITTTPALVGSGSTGNWNGNHASPATNSNEGNNATIPEKEKGSLISGETTSISGGGVLMQKAAALASGEPPASASPKARTKAGATSLPPAVTKS
ncbi:unnamed protein product [Amoebophrya sp. A25]|nr:unnamed protein product [Amoebophrya sp. A25]|eukprot:GSA25T00014352001.1